MKELTTRIIVAIIGIPLLLFCIWKGGYWFFAAILIMSIAGQREMYDLFKAKQLLPQTWPGYLLTAALLYLIGFGFNVYIISASLFLLLYIFGSEMFRNIGSPLLNTAGTVLGVVYPGAFLGALLFLRQHLTEIFGSGQPNSAPIFVLSVFISVWVCDTMAYFVGVSLGRHRLFKRVSPKKSIEGAVAGVIGAVLIFLSTRWLGLIEISPVFLLISGLIVGVGGQFGDLIESWLKRDAKVKDSSKILPGHGGFLDRFDSLSYISPAFLILFLLWK